MVPSSWMASIPCVLCGCGLADCGAENFSGNWMKACCAAMLAIAAAEALLSTAHTAQIIA